MPRRDAYEFLPPGHQRPGRMVGLGAIFPVIGRDFLNACGAVPVFAPTQLPGLLRLGGASNTDGAAGSVTTPNTNPGTFAGTANPTWAAGPPVSVQFAAASNNRVEVPSGALTVAGRNGAGVGLNATGPEDTIEMRVTRVSAVSAAALATDGSANIGFWLDAGVPSFYTGAYQHAGGALTLGTEYHLLWTFGADGTVQGYVNGVAAGASFNYTSAFTIVDIGGSRASAAYGAASKQRDTRRHGRVLTQAEITARAAGTELPFYPAYNLPMNDGSGTSCADATKSVSEGGVVATLTDTLALNHLSQATGSKKPILKDASVPQAMPLLGGMAKVVRFDGVDDTAAKQGVFGAAVTEFSVVLAGRYHNPPRLDSTWNKPAGVWGASSASTGTWDGVDSSAYLGSRYGRTPQDDGGGGVDVPMTFECGVRAAGGSAKTAAAVYAHAFPTVIAVTFKGSTYLRLWVLVGGVMTMVAENTTSIPASLDLSGIYALCPANGTILLQAGYELFADAAGSVAWSATQLGQLATWMQAQGFTAPAVTYSEVMNYGDYNGSGYGWGLGASTFKTASGRLLTAATIGATDPNNNMEVRVAKSLDGGLTHTSIGTVFHDSTPLPTYVLGGSLCQIPVGRTNAGRVRIFMSTAPVAGSPWISYQAYSDNDGDTWSAAVVMTVSGMGAYTYYAPVGRCFDLGGGLWRLMAYGVYTATGHIHNLILESSDDGLTWALKIDLALAGSVNAGLDPQEGTFVLLGGSGASRRWLVIHRCPGGREMISRSLDDMATWTTAVRAGATLGANATYAMPCLVGPVNGKVYWFRSIRAQGAGITWGANDRMGVVVQYSTDEGYTWSAPVLISMEQYGWAYPSALDLDGSSMFVAYSDARAKIAGAVIPYSALAA